MRNENISQAKFLSSHAKFSVSQAKFLLRARKRSSLRRGPDTSATLPSCFPGPDPGIDPCIQGRPRENYRRRRLDARLGPRITTRAPRHCERSEAIHLSTKWSADEFPKPVV